MSQSNIIVLVKKRLLATDLHRSPAGSTFDIELIKPRSEFSLVTTYK